MLRRSVWRFVAAATVMFMATLLALPEPAGASSFMPRMCLVRTTPFDAFKDADVVAEGVLLSGPTVNDALLSPARFHVVRYLKGRGPRVIRVKTPQRQVVAGDFRVGPDGYGNDSTERARTPDTDIPRAGEAYRIFAQNREHRGRGVVKGLIDTCTGDDRKVSIRRLLRPVPRTTVRAQHGHASWRARLFRGRRRLRCVRLVEPSAHFETHGACGYLHRRHSTLVATDDDGTTTAIAIAGRGLRGFTATRLSDGAQVNAAVRRRLAFAAVPGSFERKELLITARYRDGSTRRYGGLDRRATFVDPAGTPQWSADHEPAYPSTSRRRACVVVGPGPVLGRSGECGSTARTPLFFAIRRVTSSTDPGGRLIVSHRTAVFGATSPAVSDVTVTGPSGLVRPAISRRGRSFIALLAGHIPVSQLTLRFVLRDGRTLTYHGRRELNLAPRRQ